DDEDDDVSFGGGDDDRAATQALTQTAQASQWSAFWTADARATLTATTASPGGGGGDEGGRGYEDDGDRNDDGDGESPVRRRAIRFDSSAKKALRSRARSKGPRGLPGEEEEEDYDDNDDEGGGEPPGASSKRGGVASKQRAEENDDPVQTVRNLCRRAQNAEEREADPSRFLEEVAPLEVWMREGRRFRMDPLRCRQEGRSKAAKGKPTSSKKVAVSRPPGKGQSKAEDRAGADPSDSEQSLSDPEPSFKDPISDFPSRVAARLNAGLDFLIEKEGRSRPRRESADQEATAGDDRPSAALLSMTLEQILCVASKLLFQTTKPARAHQRSSNGGSASFQRRRRTPSSSSQARRPPSKDADPLAGGTLLVLRGKEDLSRWLAALRERTSLSVLDHASMPSTARKLSSAAGKCAGFDVVLTTYDALKAKEVTMPVDPPTGRAVLGGDPADDDDGDGADGWFTARDASGTQATGGRGAPRECRQLSVLHRVAWFRVVFVDVLGRKGFLTKPGTARAMAAVAVNSKSRIIFFEKEETTNKAEEKFKDDRRQLRSIINALHLPEQTKLNELIGSYILDINQMGKTKEAKRRESSSEDEEYVSEEENSHDDLADPW
ncbi:hypothetical protein ACHAWF_007899, partial [Thalassiosira exigua]